MTLYAILDLIADSYNPFILFISIYSVATTLSISKREGTIKLLLLASLLTTVYIVQAIDHYFGFWTSLESDYSTHTAFSLAIIFFFLFKQTKLKILIASTFIAYLVLMLYQEYHTLIDILSTIAILSPVFYLFAYIARLQIQATDFTPKD